MRKRRGTSNHRTTQLLSYKRTIGLERITIVPMRFSILGVCIFSLIPSIAQTPAIPRFEVASIRRNTLESRPWLVPPTDGRFTATNVTLKLLIGVGWSQKVTGGPSWVSTDGYDVSAKEPEGNLSDDKFSLMMQNLLKDRFRLRVHTELRPTTVYVLKSARSGLKLPEANSESCLTGSNTPEADPRMKCGSMNVTPELILNEKISMEWFTGVLGEVLGRPVLNETGFAGSFKVHLEFAPMDPIAIDNNRKPSIFSVLEQQLGLKIESQRGTEEILVIDHVERPSEN